MPAGSTVTLLNGLSVYVPETAKAELLRTGSPGGGVPPERLTIDDPQLSCGGFSVYSDPDRGATMPSIATAMSWRRLARLDDGTQVRWTASKTAGLWVVVLTHVPGKAPGMVSAVWFRRPSPTTADVRSVVTQIWKACRIRGAGAALTDWTATTSSVL